MKQNSFSKKKVNEYVDLYGAIPKDFEERLKWLFNEIAFTNRDVETLFSKIDSLINAEWETLTYIFYMEPSYSARPRSNRNTFTFYVPESHDAQAMFSEFMDLHANMKEVISTPCILETHAYTKTPVGMSRVEHLAAELELIRNLNSPDWDNIGKLYCDMVQNALISNDSIVFRGAVEKFYSVLPRVEIIVRYMKKYDCRYNKRSIEKRKSFQENPKTKKDIDYII
ncbi:MAG: RusA family crossover junction endodeoxyribonuclease [Lachnospiraceae bacterium]|nr:RusA family crossover junction endodeoxyribonuclease [Lachnospiraceae bacterium]